MEISKFGGTWLTPEGLSELIGLVYESALEETQWQSLLDGMARFFPDTTLSVIGYNGDHVRIPYAVAGLRPPNYERIEENLQIEMTKIIEADPRILEHPLGFISDSRETWRGAFHQSTFYENVVRPMGFDHYLSLARGQREDIRQQPRTNSVVVMLPDEQREHPVLVDHVAVHPRRAHHGRLEGGHAHRNVRIVIRDPQSARASLAVHFLHLVAQHRGGAGIGKPQPPGAVSLQQPAPVQQAAPGGVGEQKVAVRVDHEHRQYQRVEETR